jgi:hypothetical protein
VAKSGPILSSSVDGIIRLAKVFPELPTAQLADMQCWTGLSKPKGAKAPSTVHGPSRRQILIAVSPVPVGFNPANLLDQIRTTLGLHHSQLVVHSVSLTSGGFSVVTGLVASGDDVSHILEATRVVFPAATSADAALPSSTSYLKLVDVPYVMNNKAIMPDGVLTHIACARVKDLVVLQGPLRVVCDLVALDMATVYMNVADSVSGVCAKALIGQMVQFGQFVAVFRAARANLGSPLCQWCWKWGHPTTACWGPQIKCPIWTGPHRNEHHHTLAGCCKGGLADQPPPVGPTPEGAPCPHPARCINCHKPHAADDCRCAFWHHRFNRDWIQVRYEEVHEWKRSHSPPTSRPAGSGGRP